MQHYQKRRIYIVAITDTLLKVIVTCAATAKILTSPETQRMHHRAVSEADYFHVAVVQTLSSACL